MYGINPTFSTCARSELLSCTFKPVAPFNAEEAPPAKFLMNPRAQNYVTLQCPYPFQDICNASEFIQSGKLMANNC
jgi:hypothetical protein